MMMKENRMRQYKMVMRLAANDMKARYSASALGVVWAFIQPLITILVFWFVFQAGFKTAPVDNVPYILWFIVGYVPWIYFSDVLNFGVNVLSDYSYLVKKVKFQVEYLPVIRIISSFFVHVFFVVFIFFMFGFYRYRISLKWIQAVYYSGALTVFSWGVIMLFSALSVFYKDISQLVSVILQIGFWATPVFWNPDTIHDIAVRKVLGLNPMYYIVEGYRACFIRQDYFWDHPLQAAYFWGITGIVCCVGLSAFKRLRPHFADGL